MVIIVMFIVDVFIKKLYGNLLYNKQYSKDARIRVEISMTYQIKSWSKMEASILASFRCFYFAVDVDDLITMGKLYLSRLNLGV